MKAIGYITPGAIDRAGALQDIDLPRPAPARMTCWSRSPPYR